MKIILTIDSYIHFDWKKFKQFDNKCAKLILKKFTKRNPKIWQLKRLGFSTHGVPHKIRSYFFKAEEIFIYRGGYKKLKKIFEKFNHSVLTRDHRISFPPISFSSNIKLRSEQVEPVAKILEKEQGLIRGACSCLVGDTKIRINRGGKGSEVSLERMYLQHKELTNKICGKAWDLKIPTKVRSYNGNTIQLNNIENIFCNGRKIVYEIILKNGKKIQATADHGFMTNNGWCELQHLKIGVDLIMVDTLKPEKSISFKKKRKRPNMICNLWYHRFAGKQKINKVRRGFTKRLLIHRAIYEANFNNLSLEKYIEIFRHNKIEAKKLKVFDPAIFDIHHLNFDESDNKIQNLALMHKFDHKKLHSEAGVKFNFNQGIPKYSKVIKKRKIGKKKVYDICCADPNHNFVANSMVVHNSGKTIILLEAIAKAKQHACVVVWNTTHQKQWIKAALDPKLLNFRKSDLGGIGGVFAKPKFGKLNICMQQSLFNLAKRNALGFFSDRCGFIGCDEVQRFAASTFQNVINEFPAKYRIGVSANEKRKDRCQFLIYDSFGKIIHKIEDKNIESRIKAKIYLIPTKFYDEDYDDNPNQRVSMITNMCEDTERNKLILYMVRRSVAKGKICLILTERKEHAIRLKFHLSKLRTGFLIGSTSKESICNMGFSDRVKNYMLDLDLESEEKRVFNLARKRKLDVIVGTQKVDVGLDIRTLDHLFLTMPSGNNIERFNQQKGRIERSHGDLEKYFGEKAIPKVYYFWDVKMERLKEAGNNIIKAFPSTNILKLKNRKGIV